MDKKQSPEEIAGRAELARLEAQFAAAGGRGVELADEIDELRAELDGPLTCPKCGSKDKFTWYEAITDFYNVSVEDGEIRVDKSDPFTNEMGDVGFECHSCLHRFLLDETPKFDH